VKTIREDFGIDAVQANSLKVCLAIAKRIRKTDPSMHTIFIATDSTEVIQQIPKHSSWRFVYQNGKVATRTDQTTTASFAWFRHMGGKGAILTDIELMRNADYVIGSMISNVFRLVAELREINPQLPKDSVMRLQRVFSVDVEWYQDP
jgi:hypothetical protein